MAYNTAFYGIGQMVKGKMDSQLNGTSLKFLAQRNRNYIAPDQSTSDTKATRYWYISEPQTLMLLLPLHQLVCTISLPILIIKGLTFALPWSVIYGIYAKCSGLRWRLIPFSIPSLCIYHCAITALNINLPVLLPGSIVAVKSISISRNQFKGKLWNSSKIMK